MTVVTMMMVMVAETKAVVMVGVGKRGGASSDGGDVITITMLETATVRIMVIGMLVVRKTAILRMVMVVEMTVVRIMGISIDGDGSGCYMTIVAMVTVMVMEREGGAWFT